MEKTVSIPELSGSTIEKRSEPLKKGGGEMVRNPSLIDRIKEQRNYRILMRLKDVLQNKIIWEITVKVTHRF